VVIEGQTVDFQCEAKGYPQPVIAWTKGGELRALALLGPFLTSPLGHRPETGGFPLADKTSLLPVGASCGQIAHTRCCERTEVSQVQCGPLVHKGGTCGHHDQNTVGLHPC
jgi:hypothetical protein